MYYTDYVEGVTIGVNNGVAVSYEYFPAAKDYHLKCQKIDIPKRLQSPCESQIFPFDPSGSYSGLHMDAPYQIASETVDIERYLRTRSHTSANRYMLQTWAMILKRFNLLWL